MTDLPKLSPRLRAAASLVRRGSFVADIGTDHAYLPIALCLEGRIRGGVASDINDGPVERGKKNIKKYGLEEKLLCFRADGLDTIERFCPEDILILGMGGELIARILGDAPWTKDTDIRLCLQPMTHAEVLRGFLAQNGYEILDELTVAEDGRIYQLICAKYSGEIQSYTGAELLLGRINIERRTDTFLLLAEKTLAAIERRIDGKRCAGEDISKEKAVAEEIQRIIREGKNDGKAAL